MWCIFCYGKNTINEINPYTNEHCFPESIGGLPLKILVCQKCNNSLGSEIDKYLVDHPLIVLERSKHGLIEKPSLFNKLFIKPFIDNASGTKWKFDNNNGFSMVSPKYQERGNRIISVTSDDKNIERAIDDINKKSRRRGLHELDESSKSRIRDNFKNFSKRKVSLSNDLKIDEIEYQRAVLKIAYEYAFYWLGDQYSYDPLCEKIRLCLLHPKSYFDSGNHWSRKYIIEGHIGSYENENLSKIFKLWDKHLNSHIAFLMKRGNSLICGIRVFKIFMGRILLSKEANKYKNIGLGCFWEVDVSSGLKIESTLEEEIYKKLK
jgi:hypothetical protein